MTTQEKLIAAMRAAFPNESQAALARRAGLGVQRFNNYCTGIRTMDVDAVIGCAQALGWDVRATVAQHEMETAPTPRVRALWRHFATTATLLALGVLGAAHGPAEAAPDARAGSHFAHNGQECTLCQRVRWLWRLVRDLLASKLPRAKSSDTLEASICL